MNKKMIRQIAEDNNLSDNKLRDMLRRSDAPSIVETIVLRRNYWTNEPVVSNNYYDEEAVVKYYNQRKEDLKNKKIVKDENDRTLYKETDAKKKAKDIARANLDDLIAHKAAFCWSIKKA